jgi:predicted small metal-binding protein
MTSSTTGRPTMAKVIHCPCGTDVRGETDDELVAAVEEHVKENHPDRVGTMSREEILAGAHEH